MKFTIKEITEKFDNNDRVKFPAKIKDVYDAKEAVTKYSVSRQNIIVDDGTASVKVIVSHKTKEDEYTKDIIGKDIEVDGKLSIWEGKKNIFGKLIFKDGEPKKTTANVSNQIRPATSALPPIVEIREMALKMAIDFWGSRIGHEKDEKGVIETADLFKEYLLGKAEKATQRRQKVEEPKEEEKPEEKKTEKPKGEAELSAEKIALINEIMSLKESRNLNKDTFAHYLDNKDIKEMSIEELKKAKMDIGNITDQIPF